MQTQIEHRMGVAMDLSEAAVEEALEINARESIKGSKLILITPIANAHLAGRLCQKYGMDWIGLPDEIMEEDSWAIVDDWIGIFSEGA